MKDLIDKKEFEVEINEEAPPLVKEGTYEAIYVRHKKARYFTGTKLYVYFKIVSPGEHCNVELYRPYTVYDVPKRNSDFVKECELVIGHRLKKKEKASIAVLKNKVLKVKVKTVKSNRKQEPLPPHMCYSKIESILEVLTGHK